MISEMSETQGSLFLHISGHDERVGMGALII